jgi:hypothetical protein
VSNPRQGINLDRLINQHGLNSYQHNLGSIIKKAGVKEQMLAGIDDCVNWTVLAKTVKIVVCYEVFCFCRPMADSGTLYI